MLNQFVAPRTNKRTDSWGGTPERRRRFPVEIVRRTRTAVGSDFIICYRMSMADYVEDGQSWDEISKGPQGGRLGKTSGWVHRASLKAKGVRQLSGVNYEQITDDGLHISFGPDRRRPQLLAVDNVVICAGQEPVRDLEADLRREGIDAHIIGGAAVAVELDAKRAIRQGTELAARL